MEAHIVTSVIIVGLCFDDGQLCLPNHVSYDILILHAGISEVRRRRVKEGEAESHMKSFTSDPGQKKKEKKTV